MPPYREDPERVNYFAETDSRGKKVRFGIKAKDRLRHMYVIGKTGMGKSTLLENLAIQDIQNGEGLAFIDPHGSTAERLLDYVPEERIKDVLYIAPFDMENPVGFNVMEDVGYDKRHLVVSGLMSAFKRIWEDAWSARMEYILSNTLLALLEYPGSTLLDVNRMYTDKAFRKKVVDYISDPLVKRFWAEEFAGYTDRYTQEATPAIQNKVGQFTSNPLVRNIIGQSKSSFDIRRMMDERKILIVNLSKGRIGETNANLLGSMLTTKIYLSAMSRADLPLVALNKLPNFNFYVDEFQSVANDSFADILSEARKYKLALVIAHQYIEQMEENVRNAIFGNVGTIISFRVGPFDAETLEVVFQPQFMATDLVNLGFAQIYLTLMIDGIGSRPFSATTIPLIPPPRLSYTDHIIAHTRKTYGRPRTQVEANMSERNKPVAPERIPVKGEHSVNDGRGREEDRPPRRESKSSERGASATQSPRTSQGRAAAQGERLSRHSAPEPTTRKVEQPAVSLKELLAQKAQSGTVSVAPVKNVTRLPDSRANNSTKEAKPEHREQLRTILSTLAKQVSRQAPAQKNVSETPMSASPQKKKDNSWQESNVSPVDKLSKQGATPSSVAEMTPDQLKNLLKIEGD